jgi:hypothetical protein
MRLPVVALAIAALAVTAQVPVHVQSRQNEQSVIVEGCLHGKRFIPDLTMANTALVFRQLKVKELRLEGQAGLMKTLEKQHDGHQDEITGLVIVPNNTDTRVQGKQIGKRTRVTTTSSGSDPDPRSPGFGGAVPAAGSTGQATNSLPSPQWLRMKVTSLRHINDRCQFAEEPTAHR